jgi:hypothetical protein
MTTTCSLRLSVELQADGERIAGLLRDQHGNDWPFSSWLGLLILVERLRARASSSLTNEPARREVSG